MLAVRFAAFAEVQVDTVCRGPANFWPFVVANGVFREAVTATPQHRHLRRRRVDPFGRREANDMDNASGSPVANSGRQLWSPTLEGSYRRIV